MALPLHFDSTLRLFRHPEPIPVFDTVGDYVHGSWQETELVQRAEPISAVVLAMNASELHIYKEGDVSVAGIALLTKATLYFTDIKILQTGWEVRQSYVEYKGFRFRVMGAGMLPGNADFEQYHCVRHFR